MSKEKPEVGDVWRGTIRIDNKTVSSWIEENKEECVGLCLYYLRLYGLKENENILIRITKEPTNEK